MPRGTGRGSHDRHVHTVQLQGRIGDAAPTLDEGVCVEKFGGVLARDVAQPTAAVHVVGPVPAVERRMADQGAETRPERDRGHDDGDGEDRTQDRRPHGDGASSHPRLEGESHAGDRRRRQARGAAAVVTRDEGIRWLRVRALPGRARHEARAVIAPSDNRRPATPSPITVQSACTSTRRNGRTGPSGASGDRQRATAPARTEPTATAPSVPIRSSQKAMVGLARGPG